ncbi:hypothetical protein H1R20_g15000, partial [Candolleomyces eurysporus]
MSTTATSRQLTRDELLTKDYVDEDHIAAFAHALQEDEAYFDNHADGSSPAAPGTPPTSTHAPRIRKVSALSDFAPINLRVARRRRKKEKDQVRHDLLFLLLRWPLLGFIFVVIMAEFGFYVVIRQLVNTKEWISAWRGKKGALRKKLRAAKTYEEWKEAAKVLDNYLHFDEWKQIDEDPFYDWKLVKKVKRSLKTLREKQDARGCLGVLETCIRSNFAAIESSRLYSETYLGTKDLIESYFDELERSLEFIRQTPDLSLDEKRRFFKNANTNLASAAVPGILNPVVIMQKLKDGSIVPWNWGSRFKDGSLRVDIPVQSLNLYFNGWRGNFLLSAAEQWLKHELTKNFKVIRDLELLPQLLGQDWSSVFLQRFDGAVTIWPRTRIWDWVRILSDPDPEELARMLHVGQMVTWPKLHMIENRMRIEKQIYGGRQDIRRILKSKSRTQAEPRSLLLPPHPVEVDAALRSQSNASQSPPPTGSEQPLSVDTDAEAAFARGSRWFYRRGRHSRPPSPGPGGSDPLLSPSIRKKWSSNLLDIPSKAEGRDVESEERVPGEQADDPPDVRPSASAGSFFSRLRKNSIPLSFTHGLRSRKGSDEEPDYASDNNPKYQQFKPTNTAIKRELIDRKGVLEYAIELGFRPDVENFQPYYRWHKRHLEDLQVGTEVLKEFMELHKREEERASVSKLTIQEERRAAAEKVKLAYMDDRKTKMERDEMEKQARGARASSSRPDGPARARIARSPTREVQMPGQGETLTSPPPYEPPVDSD